MELLDQLGMSPGRTLIAIAAIILLIILFPRYHKVPPNEALIISGKIRRRYKVKDADGNLVIKKFGYRIVRGGATFVIPFFERVDRLNLGLMQVDIKTTQPVPSQEYISVMVDGVANIKIGSDDVSIATAAEQFLNWKQENIALIAQQVLEGNMREIIGRMTIADLVQNRDKFATETTRAASYDMGNMGLEIINLTIQNFADGDGVVETMATRNIVEKQRDAAIARAEAEQQGHKATVESDALRAEQNKDLALKEADFKIQADKAKAKADIAYNIEEQTARKAFEQERAAAELLRLQKQTELERQQVELEHQKLSIEIREKAEAEKDARVFRAEAEKAERQAVADAELYCPDTANPQAWRGSFSARLRRSPLDVAPLRLRSGSLPDEKISRAKPKSWLCQNSTRRRRRPRRYCFGAGPRPRRWTSRPRRCASTARPRCSKW